MKTRTEGPGAPARRSAGWSGWSGWSGWLGGLGGLAVATTSLSGCCQGPEGPCGYIIDVIPSPAADRERIVELSLSFGEQQVEAVCILPDGGCQPEQIDGAVFEEDPFEVLATLELIDGGSEWYAELDPRPAIRLRVSHEEVDVVTGEADPAPVVVQVRVDGVLVGEQSFTHRFEQSVPAAIDSCDTCLFQAESMSFGWP